MITALLALGLTLSGAEPEKAVPSEEATAPKTNTHEAYETEVLKVYSAKDGEAIFRAYVVKWKDQEVIVSDTLAQTDYQVGDVVRVLAMNHEYPHGKLEPRLLHFQITPPGRIRPIPPMR